MALYDKVRENMQKMQSGQLGGTSSEELQKQADAAGRMAPPVTPLEGAALGANPDAAKMAGTPNNKLNALQQSFRQETDKIQTTLRQQQARTQATEAEAAKKERAKQLEANLAGAPERLQQVARAAYSKIENPTANLVLDTTKFQSTLPAGADKTKASTLADKAINGTIGVDELVELEVLLGKEVTPDIIKTWYPTIPGAVADSIAAALPNNVMAGQLYETPEAKQAAADSLGVTVDALDTMTFKQLKDKAQAIQTAEFSRTESLRRAAVDPSASPAERAQARALLKDQGAIGLSSTERDVASLEERIGNGDKVSFNGKQMDIEEMLSDDVVKGTIKGALEDATKMAALEKTEPDLANLVKANRVALEAQMAKVNPKLTEYSEIQKFNKELGTLPNGMKVNDKVLGVLIPGFGKPSATKYAVPPVLLALQSDQISEADKPKILSAITRLSAYPQLGPELAALTTQQIFSLGLNDDAKVSQVEQTLQDSKELNSQAPESFTEAQLASMLSLGEGKTMKDLEGELPGLWSQAAISDPSSQLNRFLMMVDGNHDGKIDSPGVVASAARSLLGNVTNLRDALNAGIGINRPNIQASSVATTFAPYLQKGTLTQADKGEMVQKFTSEQLGELAASITGKDLGVQELIQGAANRQVDELRPSHAQNRVLKNPTDVYASDKDDIKDTISLIDTELAKPNINPVHKQALLDRKAKLAIVVENFTFATRKAKRLLDHAKHWASALGRSTRGESYDTAVAEIEHAMSAGNVDAINAVVQKFTTGPTDTAIIGGKRQGRVTNMAAENSNLVKDLDSAKTDKNYGGW